MGEWLRFTSTLQSRPPHCQAFTSFQASITLVGSCAPVRIVGRIRAAMPPRPAQPNHIKHHRTAASPPATQATAACCFSVMLRPQGVPDERAADPHVIQRHDPQRPCGPYGEREPLQGGSCFDVISAVCSSCWFAVLLIQPYNASPAFPLPTHSFTACHYSDPFTCCSVPGNKSLICVAAS